MIKNKEVNNSMRTILFIHDAIFRLKTQIALLFRKSEERPPHTNFIKCMPMKEAKLMPKVNKPTKQQGQVENEVVIYDVFSRS